MSHFTVMVIGLDPEDQLGPFHEFGSTGDVDEYVIDVDITDEAKDRFGGGTDAEFLKFCQEEYNYSTVTKGEAPDITGENMWGYVLVDKKGKVLKVIDRTNPNAKWDWYVLGGRWTGYFKLKKGRPGITGEPGIFTEKAKSEYADSALKCDIDFEGMRKEDETEAAERYDKARSIIDLFPKASTFQEINEHCADRETALEKYNSQLVVQMLRKAGFGFWGIDLF